MNKEVYYKLQGMYSSKVDHFQVSINAWNTTPCDWLGNKMKSTICKYFNMNPDVAGVFDCCCADGTLLEGFKKAGFKVKGFDISEEFVGLAHSKGRDFVQLMNAEDVVENYPWYVIAFDAFEHLPIKVLDKLLDEINKFGILLIGHNYTSEWKELAKEKDDNRMVEDYDVYKDSDEIHEHMILKPYAWWLEKLKEHLTNFVRLDIPTDWDILGKPRMGLFIYERKGMK